MSNVLIGCKLPQGITVNINAHDPASGKLVLNGMNTSLVHGGYGITSVEKSSAEMFFATHADYDPVKAGAIFTHNTDKVADLIDVAADLKGEATGFEGMDPSAPMAGIKEENPEQRAKATTTAALPPVRAPKSKADKAIAVEVAAATKA